MNNFAVYIIFSQKLNRFYIGTTDDFIRRLDEHNSIHHEQSFSKNGIPWESFLVIENLESEQAYKMEKHIKSMKSSTYIRNLKKYPEMVDAIKKRFG